MTRKDTFLTSLLLAMTILLAMPSQSVAILGADGKECLDEHENCPYWAATGECDNNRKYMYDSCRVSCDRCHIVRVGSQEEMQAFIASKKAELEEKREALAKKKEIERLIAGIGPGDGDDDNNNNADGDSAAPPKKDEL